MRPCAGQTDLFYSHDRDDIEEARALCGTCDERDECLSRAQRNREPGGVWGGQLVSDGQVVRLGAHYRRPGPPQRQWTEAEDAQLRLMRYSGLTWHQTGKRLGVTAAAAAKRFRYLARLVAAELTGT